MSSANTKIYFFHFALLFICFNANTLLSQTLSPDSAFLKIYNTVPGVPFNRINDIIQTSDRYLWVAAPEGLFRYDGFRFKSINLPDSSFPKNVNIRTLFEDSQNKLWIGTEKGVLIRRSNGEWDSITTRTGLSNEQIRCIAEDFDGNIWIGTEGGVTRYRPRKTPPPVRINKITADREATRTMVAIIIIHGARCSQTRVRRRISMLALRWVQSLSM